MKSSLTIAKSLLGLVLIGTLPQANATLYDRGNGMIYDDVKRITWLQDANYAKTSGYDADGKMTWANANTWADQLEYGGYDDWRLASANLMNGASPCNAYDGSCDIGFNNTTGELGHMFYNNLGNLGRYDSSGADQAGYGVTNSSFTDATPGGGTESFLNVQSSAYWFGEEYAPSTTTAWAFYTDQGDQFRYPKNSSIYSWAVRAGDVSSVPEPGSLGMLALGLFGLIGARRKHR